jgi:hypothetical protein
MPEDRKPCAGCGVEVLWARHERTGKAAPLVLAAEDEKPNIAVYEVFHSTTREPGSYYSIGRPAKMPIGDAAPVQYVNHFSNCPKAANFKRR